MCNVFVEDTIIIGVHCATIIGVFFLALLIFNCALHKSAHTIPSCVIS